MTYNISSNVSKTMAKIYEAHWETGNEIASKNGKAIAFAQRDSLTSNTTAYNIEYVNGKRRIVKGNSTRPVGTIVNKQGVTLRTRLENLIGWRTYSKSGVTVVAGIFKNSWTEIRENGKVIGRTKVPRVGEGNINILQKLNYGLNSESNKINSLGNQFSWQGGKSIESFKGTHQRGYGFAEEGRRNAMDKVNSNIKQGFAEALARREKFASNQKMERVV